MRKPVSLAIRYIAAMKTLPIVAALACGSAHAANPIRKVVTMLQNVQKKVEAEGKKEEEMFEKFLCYCSTSGTTLKDSIASNTAKVPEIQSDIEEGEAQVKQLGEDLKKHSADRAAAKDASSAQISAIAKAVAALEKGAGGAFLQTHSA